MIECHGFDQDEKGTPYIVFEYANGGNLRQFLKRSSSLGTLRFEIADMILEALQYLHEEAYLMHCNLKPENILIFVDAHNRIANLKLTDFGIVPPTKLITQEIGAEFETYLAPEILIGGRRVYTFSADVFSSAAVFFYIMDGKSPWLSKEDYDVCRTREAKFMSLLLKQCLSRCNRPSLQELISDIHVKLIGDYCSFEFDQKAIDLINRKGFRVNHCEKRDNSTAL